MPNDGSCMRAKARAHRLFTALSSAESYIRGACSSTPFGARCDSQLRGGPGARGDPPVSILAVFCIA